MEKNIVMDDYIEMLVDAWQQVKSEGLAAIQPNLFDPNI